MIDLNQVRIKPFQPEDQAAVKQLILDGLVEHWGVLDPTKNPDLEDIQTHYQNATFLVAHKNNLIVGCGALVPINKEVGEIVRMSIRRSARRLGLGSVILRNLLEEARKQKITRIILETTATWSEVVNFYIKNGFQITHYLDDDVYFSYQLNKIKE